MNEPHAAQWVAVVGDNTVDRYLGADAVDYSGGNAFNVAVQLARTGVSVRYFGAIAADDDAEIIMRGLTVNGISLDDLVVLPGRTAITDIRLTHEGDRIFEREEFGVTADYYPDAEAIETIASAGWVHIGMLPKATELRVALASVGHTLVSQDCEVAAGLDHLDVAFLSAGEGGDAEGIAAPVLAHGVPLVVVTRGAEGALASDGSTSWSQQAVATQVVDTTGAGDSFIAGFIAHRVSGGDIADALGAGAILAAATCAHPAGWPHPSTDTPAHEQKAKDAR